MVLKIEGMGCMHCVARVKNALNALGADVKNVEIGSAEIGPFQDTDKIKEAIEGLGFKLVSIE